MKTFFKIFFIILLMGVIGAAITIFVLTLTGNGGQEKSLKLLEKVYTKREQYLDGMYCEIDYSSSIKKFGDESKTKQNAKYYFGFDGDLRKLVTVFYDADGNFAYMTYKEYEIESETHVVVKDYGVYEQNKTSYSTSDITFEQYEEECSFSPEFRLKEIYDMVREENMDSYFADIYKQGDEYEFEVNLSTNIFKDEKKIDVTAEYDVGYGENQAEGNKAFAIVLQDNLLKSYSYEAEGEMQKGEVESKEKCRVNISYHYTKGQFSLNELLADLND